MSALLEVTQQVAGYMERIVKLFKPGVRITVLVRTPGFPTRDFMLSDDEPAEVIAMLERRKTAGPDSPEAKR